MTKIERAVAVAVLLLACAGPAGAQETRAAPGGRYEAGSLKSWLLGEDYRDLWVTPVSVPVLDLGTFAGGLTPVRRGGGNQTVSLRFLGADGREYTFRSVFKVPELARHPDLEGALLGDLIQDQASSIVPAAPLIAGELSAAADLLAPAPRLFLMPDDPRLGEFREDYAGMLGTLEEHADEPEHGGPGFAGYERIVATETMLEHLEEDPGHRADSRTFLAARLLDLLIGDWDRHEDQWRWARVDDGAGTLWVPIARDRDYAFANYDGVLLNVARRAVPNAVRFGRGYGSVEGLLLNAATLDRELLAWVDWPVWDSVATELRDRITDAEIERAVRRLPAEHHALRGEELALILRERRDRLPEAAAAFYGSLSRLVEIRGTDAAERLEVARRADGRVEVTMSLLEEGNGAGPRQVRVFDPVFTQEVRIHLRGGDDEALVHGSSRRGLLVRVLGGGGDDELTDRSTVTARGRWTSLHDAGEDDRLTGSRGTIIDRRPYVEPELPELGLIRIRPPDIGTSTSWAPVLDYSTTSGAVVGVGVSRTRYAFRHHPYASRIGASLRYSPRWSSLAFSGTGHFQWRNPALSTTARLLASGIDAVRFHGFGNESEALDPPRHYLVRREILSLGGDLRVVTAPGLTLFTGPFFRSTRPLPEPGSFLEQSRPFGFEGTTALGARAGVELRRGNAEEGTLEIGARAGGSASQPLRGGDDLFGDLHGTAGAVAPLGPAWVGARAGWRAAWGSYPFEEAAFLGGIETLRGFPEWRFAGDAVVHGTLESGVAVGRLPLVMNWRSALFAFVDAGRVYLEGERSGRWHSAPGVGLQLSALDFSFRLTYAHGPTGRVYLETRGTGWR